jgi:hypothetical protein
MGNEQNNDRRNLPMQETGYISIRRGNILFESHSKMSESLYHTAGTQIADYVFISHVTRGLFIMNFAK